MGAKYLPTIKDHKASQRFQKQGFASSKFIKPSPSQHSPVSRKVAKPAKPPEAN